MRSSIGAVTTVLLTTAIATDPCGSSDALHALPDANRTSCLCYSLDQSNKQHRGRGDIRWTCTLARLQMGLPQRPEVRRPQEQNQSPTPKAARGGGAWVVIASGRAVVDT